ncbi:hypothetical protein EXIGLDRAFT_778111 [Exidia glandulosa HHB12029]|uniref:Golgi apparatus membrane protein TVP38 n=1 Tax=Exidia glandulosa HHB12029 TaxID=1314781 RepID=A0A165ZI01_EXIGL|nr:hypothetical protein EXIGLDRAFT_778111 [Exidia glandulosa HHB12029]
MERELARTPSPTPTELAEINAPLYDLTRWKRKEAWLKWRLVPWYIVIIVLVTGATLLTVFNKEIIAFIQPAAVWLHTRPQKFGWIIPVALLVILSFPPLFGHGVIAIVCGIVWGLGVGFALVCIGTLLGEIANYYAFKSCCRGRAEKLEENRPYYACLARVVRTGGFKVALMVRLSAIPSHFATAVFATCGMKMWVFLLAAVLSLPKQFVIVYLGVILNDASRDDADAAKDKSNKTERIISDIVAAASVLVTIGSLWWINRELKRVKPSVMADRRRARLAALRRQVSDPEMVMFAATQVYATPETALASSASAVMVSQPVPLVLAEDRRLHVA